MRDIKGGLSGPRSARWPALPAGAGGSGGGGWVTSVQADKVGQCTCGSVASADTHWDEFERK